MGTGVPGVPDAPEGLASLARAAPCALATVSSRSFSSPAGLAARTTTTVLNIQSVRFQEEPTAAANKFRLVLAGTALGALMSSEVECAPKKRHGRSAITACLLTL